MPGSWVGTVEPASNGGWFDLDLGIEIGEQTVPLLPLLQGLGRSQETGPSLPGPARAAPHDEILVRHEQSWLALPTERVRAVVDALVELHDLDQQLEAGRLRLPALRARELDTLDRHGGLRWSGSSRARLAALAGQLRDCLEPRALPTPEGFRATLRPYQARGLGWLDALGALGIGGVLADDMGLGKTVQALAHLAREKQAGRLDRPWLVVAPTSVIANWHGEAGRLAPMLRVLVLHGAARGEQFGAIEEHDLVVTTYALALRDRGDARGTALRLPAARRGPGDQDPRSSVRGALARCAPTGACA